MAAVSAAFALISALKVTPRYAIVFAVLWGLAIMMIDRLFVSTMRRQANRLFTVFQASPRFLMAIVMGFVISTPFVLQIFKPEINNEILTLQAQQRAAYYQSLPSSPLYEAVQTDAAHYAALKSQAAVGSTPIDVSDDKQIKTWNQQLTNANNKVQYWTTELDCQLYGGTNNGAKCSPGYGPIGHDDQAKINYWQNQANTLTQEIQKRTTQLEHQDQAKQKAQEQTAAAQLTAAKQTLDTATTQLAAQTKDKLASITHDNGILEELTALGDVTAGDFTLQIARLLLFLILLFVDIMPVFVKLMINLADPSPYDQILAGEEKAQIQAAENSRAIRLAAERQAAQAQAAGLRYWYEVMRAEPEGARANLLAARRRLEEEKRKRFERQQTRDIAAGQGLIGIGLQPDPSAWPGLTPGQPLGDGHFAWPPPRRGPGVSRQGSGDQEGGQATGPAGSMWTGTGPSPGANDSRGTRPGNGAWTAGPGPGPWTGRQAGPWSGTETQSQPRAPMGEPERGPGQAPWWTRVLRLPSFRLSWPPFRGRQGREQRPGAQPAGPPVPPGTPQSVRLLVRDDVNTADTQPLRPFSSAATPPGNSVPGDGRGPQSREEASRVGPAGPEPAQAEVFQPDFARPEPTEPGLSAWEEADAQIGEPTVAEPLPELGMARPERFYDDEEFRRGD